MRKYLMTTAAVVALGGLFSGCGNDVDLSGGSTAEFNIVQNYENAFITRFGQPDSAQTWGFGEPSASTRAVVDHPYISDGGDTYNATIAKAWQGVNAAIASGTPASYFDFMNDFKAWENSGWADKYYDVHGTVVPSDLNSEYVASALKVIVGTPEEPGLIPENQNNLGKAQSTGYSIVTTGGPVTLTPIYHNSNSGDRLCYYYYPEGQKPSAEQIKTMRKYSLGEMSNPVSGGNTHLYNNTYSLVYVDANGNCSYDFPEGYVINFVISNTWGGISKDVYQSGGVTTTTGGTEASLTSEGKFAVSEDGYYQCGSDQYINGKVQIKFGNTLGVPQFTASKQGSSFTYEGNSFNWYMEGNGVNGSLDGGNTCYYFCPEADGTINVGVKLNSGKKLYIKELGSNINPDYVSSGTSLSGYDGKTESADYTGVYSFPVKAWNWYAVYAEGSKLGFYGFEFVESNGNKQRDGVFTSALGPFDCGSSFKLGSVTVKLGKTPAYFSKAKSNGSVSGYSAYTSGTGKDGGLSGMATTYYFLAWNPGVMRVAVSLNADKRFYIKDLGQNGWNNTSGTSLSGYDGITVSSKYNGTYDFPVEANHVYAVYAEGSKLGFYGCEFLTGTSATEGTTSTSDIVKTSVATKPDYYSDGTLNQEVHSSTALGYGLNGFGESSSITNPQVSHTAVFKSGDYTFVGFEDWVDFDYNDVIFAITGTEPETPQEEIEIPDPDDPDEPTDPGTFVCRIIAEDLTVGENSDFDFNDVVFDVFCDGSKTTIRLRAAGGELPLYVAGHEVHQEFGYSGSYPIINTGWDGDIDYENRYVDFPIDGVISTRAAANNIPVVVKKRGEDKTLIDILLTARTGKVASKVCVGRDYEWCSERLDVDNKFHKQDSTKLFQQYVVGNFGDDWDAGTAWYQFRGK